MVLKQIIKEIGYLLEKGPILPGGIRSYLNVCGKPGCQCKRKVNPEKHGPYHRLSFTVAGKDSTMFIKNIHLDEAGEMVERFKALKHQLNLLALEYAQELRNNGFDASRLPVLKFALQVDNSAQIKNKCDENWKEKALQRQQKLLYNKVKIRDLEKSRKEWKQKAMTRKSEIESLQEELSEALSEQKKTKDKK